MVDVVNTVSSIQNTPLRSVSQSVSVVAPAEAAQSVNADFVSSRIRVDNLQNVAILEYVSSKTGQVIQQYPSQSQIDAFKRAEHIQIEAQQHEVHVSVDAAPASPPAPEPAAVNTPAPASTAEPAPAPAAAEGTGSGQITSVLA